MDRELSGMPARLGFPGFSGARRSQTRGWRLPLTGPRATPFVSTASAGTDDCRGAVRGKGSLSARRHRASTPHALLVYRRSNYFEVFMLFTTFLAALATTGAEPDSCVPLPRSATWDTSGLPGGGGIALDEAVASEEFEVDYEVTLGRSTFRWTEGPFAVEAGVTPLIQVHPPPRRSRRSPIWPPTPRTSR